MTHPWDEFSKSLVESVPRRESLRRLGAVFAGAVLSPLGLETAWAGNVDPCKAFCNCRNVNQQNQCLAACKACNGNNSRIAGSCGSYTCCSIASCKGSCSNLKSNPNCGACGNDCRVYGETCCGNYCADLNNDVFNCGRCGTACPAPGPYEFVTCVAGQCFYDCVAGADDCGDGTCTDVSSDSDNCGACGNVCPDSAPVCLNGACTDCLPPYTFCFGVCRNTAVDVHNCGACGFVCAGGDICEDGMCWGGGGYSPSDY